MTPPVDRLDDPAQLPEGGSSVPGAGWRVTTPRGSHPVTPLVTVARAVPVLVVFAVTVGSEAVQGVGSAVALLAAVAVLAAIGGYAYLQWSRFRFWFDADGDLRIRSGVLQLNERRVQVSRLQSVDVTQPLVARLFGLAVVRPEVAGSGDRGTRIEYLALDDAHRLRAELLARAAGVHSGDEQQAPVAPERPVLTVAPMVLLESLVLQPSTIGAVAVSFGLVALAVGTGSWGLLLPMFFLLASPFFIVGGGFLTWFGFTVADSPDGLRLRFGLTEHRAQTVPPGRVQAVRFEAPLMWRHRGWVRVSVNVAGSTSGDDAKERPSVLLPVAPQHIARAVVAEVLPGTDPFSVPLQSVPRAARWRAPLQFARLAAGSDDSVFVARHGWLVPTWDVVPHVRTQSVRVTQGPWQRRLGLASVHVDSTPGPVKVTAAQRSASSARGWAQDQADRATSARALAPPDRWLSRGSAAAQPREESP